MLLEPSFRFLAVKVRGTAADVEFQHLDLREGFLELVVVVAVGVGDDDPDLVGPGDEGGHDVDELGIGLAAASAVDHDGVAVRTCDVDAVALPSVEEVDHEGRGLGDIRRLQCDRVYFRFGVVGDVGAGGRPWLGCRRFRVSVAAPRGSHER